MRLLATSAISLILVSLAPVVMAIGSVEPAPAMEAAEDALAKGPAPAGVYVTDPAHTSVIWSLDHMGLSWWTARFVGAEATVDWKPEDPAMSRLHVRIDPASIRTDFPGAAERDFDAEIAQGEGFLGGEPILFESRQIEITGLRTGLVEGDLTMRGETHPATLAVTFNGSIAEHPFEGVPKVGFSARTTIRRSDWGMDTLLPLIGDEVQVAIETQMVPEPEKPAVLTRVGVPRGGR